MKHPQDGREKIIVIAESSLFSDYSCKRKRLMNSNQPNGSKHRAQQVGRGTVYTCMFYFKKLSMISEKLTKLTQLCASASILLCPICKTSHRKSRSYVAHLLLHQVPGKTFACPFCKREFVSLEMAKCHLKEHIMKAYKCVFCHKCYKSMSGVEKHVKSKHLRLRIFKCKECGKRFNQKSHLKDHLKSHTQERDFVCSFCGICLSNINNLRRHERSHTGEKPFPCNDCNKRFAVFQDLCRHRRSFHTLESLLICEVCGKSVGSQQQLERHHQTHAETGIWQCSICSETFTREDSCSAHERRHAAYVKGFEETYEQVNRIGLPTVPYNQIGSTAILFCDECWDIL